MAHRKDCIGCSGRGRIDQFKIDLTPLVDPFSTAVSQGNIREVVDSLKGGQLVFSYYPDQEWLSSSPFLNCNRGGQLARLNRQATSGGG